MADLDKLIAAVEAGTARAVDFAPAFPQIGIDSPYFEARAAYGGDMNAALRLHEALLPGTFPGLSQNIHSGEWFAWVQDKIEWHFTGQSPVASRAWLLAILRALKAKGDA